jgi:hypothetical protein
MSTKKFTPYLFIGLVFLLLVLAELLVPKPLDWTVTLSSKDKNPYGAYGLGKILPDLFPEQELQHLNLSLYETDSFAAYNYLILAESFNPGKQDTEVLLQKAAEGSHVFVAASYFPGLFADTVGFQVENLLYRIMSEDAYFGGTKDSVYLRFSTAHADSNRYAYTLPAIPSYFDSLPENSQSLAFNHENKPVFFRKAWGKGQLYISSTPLAFSNYYLLEGQNHAFIESSLAHLPPAPLLWTEFYQLGRREAATPLRFVLSQPALRWGYYLGMVALLLFILFGLKRKQRPIPTLEPPENSSLQFAGAIATLYFQQGNHLNLAHKKIIYLKEYIRTQYRLIFSAEDPAFEKQLALKSNQPEEEIHRLLQLVRHAWKGRHYTAEDLLRLHRAIQAFYKTKDKTKDKTRDKTKDQTKDQPRDQQKD